MNQVHKVIWSRVKNCYIVVSEITKRVGRDNKASVTGIRPLRALLCAMVIAGCMLPADADAAPGLIHAGTGATASGDSSIAYGYSAQAKKDHSIAQGTGADAEEEYALAMGYKAIAKGLQSLAIGRQANAIGNNSIAAGAGAKGYAQDGVAIGNNAESGTADNKDPRIPTILSKNGVAVGNSAKASGGSSVSVGNDSIGNGPSSVAIGNAATANDVRTTAIGNNAHAEGAGSLSIGREASALTLENATSTNPLVTGDDEKLDKKGVMAIGDDAKASGNNSIALGTSAKAGDLEKTRNEDSVSLTGDVKRITKLTSTRSVNNAVAIGTESSVQSDEDIAVGYRAATVKSKYHQLPGSGQVAIGSNSNTYGTRGDVAIGSGAETNIRVKNVDHTTGTVEKPDGQSVAIGSVAKAYGSQAVAVGADTRAIGNSSVAIGTDDIQLDRTRLQSLLPGLANNENLNNKAPNDATLGSAALGDKPYYVKTASIGTASVAIGAMSQAAGDASMAMGLNALAEGDASTAIGPLARSKGKNSIAMGRTALAKEEGAVAVGNESLADGTSGTALGNKAKAKKNYDIAVGYNAAAEGNPTAPGLTDGSALSIGTNANAKGTNAVSIGNNAQATNKSTVAVGGTASGDSATSLGYVTTASGTSSVALGYYAQAAGSYGTAVGGSAKAKGESSIAVGAGAEAAGGKGNTAIGHKAKVESTAGDGNIAFGSSASVKDGAGHVVIGKNASANTVNGYGIAIGSSASIGIGAAADAAAIGTGSRVEGSGIAFGRQAQVTASSTESGIAIGTESSVDGAQKGTAIGDATTAIGTLSEAYGTGSTAIGINSLTKGVASTGIGIMARSWGTNSLALGTQVGAYGDRSSSIGDTNQVGLDMKDGSKSGKESAAVGSKNTIYGNQAYAVGAGNTIGSATVNTATEANGSAAGADQDKITTVTAGTVKGNMAGAFGYKNTINADNAYAVGSNSTVSADGAMVLGNNASVTAKDGMALGSNTKVANENAVALGAGSETAAAVATPSATINDTAHNFAGVNPASTVSVGKAGSERTITNVAAGRISDVSTDAINGSQLYAVTTEMDKGVAYAGDVKAAAAAANKFTRKLGEQTNIVGGVADASKLTDGNIGVVSNGTDTLNIKLAKDVKVDSVTAGNTVINNNGLTVGGKTYVTNNGLNANSQTITNVASGGNTTTNAANIGDVQTAVNNAVTNVTNTLTAKGLDFEGNDGAANKVHRDLGTKLTVKGGLADVTTGVSGKNLGVKKNAAGDGLDLVMSEKPEFKEVTAGTGTNKVVINDNGVHVGGKTYINNGGLNANNQRITNVATGTAGTDAVNVDQLNAAIGGTAKATTVKAKDANVTVTKGTSAETGGREYTVGLGNVVTVGQTHPVTVNGDAGTVNGLTNTTWDIDNPTVVHGQAATEDQLKTVSDGVKTNKTNITKNANDITNINTTIGKGLNFGGDSGADINKKLGDKLEIKGGASADLTDGNIGVVSDGAKLNVKLKKDVDLGPNGSLTINGKTYVNKDGLNANGQKITNVADGTVNSDAVNFGQLKDAVAAGKTILKDGKNTTVEGEGTVANPYKVNVNDDLVLGKKGADGKDGSIGVNGKDGSAVVINGKDGSIGLNGKDGANGLTIKGGDGKPGVDGTNITRLIIEEKNGKQHDIATLDDGMKYGGDTGAVIKKKLNEQVNVVGGIRDESKLTTDDNIGVVSDGTNNLKVRLAKALKGLESITAGDTFINNNGITISNGAAGNTVSLTKNGLDNGGNKITNVAAGDVSANSTDAVNGSQLHDVKTLAGQHTTVKAKDSNITVTEGTNGTGGKEYTVGLGDKVTLGTDPSKQVSIDGTTGIIKAGDKVTIDGTTGNIDAGKVKINGEKGTVNGLTNKTWDPNNITSGQAATEDQLKAVDQKITNTSEELTKKGMDFAGNDGEFHRNLGEKVTIKGEGTKDASEYSGENIKTFADANGNLTVKMDKNLKTETIVATGENGKNGKIGINGNDGKTTNISVTSDGKPGVDGAPGTTTTRIVYEKPDGTKEEAATLNDGMKYGGDTGNVIKKKLNEQVNVVGGITDETKLTTEDNLGVVSDGNNNLKVRMAKDLKGLNSVTTNTLTVGDVKIDNSGINAGNKKITNVAAGDISANSTDAVNGGQLWKTNQTINNIGGAVNELGDRMDRVGAGAAALAALHPLDFDPDDKWDVAAGYGNYKDAHAVSVGAFYRPNEDTMFSVGGSFGGGENMVNAGVSVKLGQGNHVSTSKVAMAKEIVDLRDENKDLKKRLDTMEQKMNSILGILDMGKKKDFPDVPENHWAYEYVATLAGNGILEGYPDGMFSGDRTMTRYEFAAMFYRALKNGAPVDDNMDRAMNEFEPELRQIRLDRIRVDRISGKDNDRNKVERVRVNSEDDKANNDYRDVYGSHISPEA